MAGLDLAAGVPKIPFRHDVEERRELATVAVEAVDAVGDGDEADVLLPEEHFRVKARLQIIPAYPAHILADDRIDAPALYFGNKGFPAGTVKVSARPAVICKMDEVRKAVLTGVVLQHFLLRGDGIGFAALFVVAAETLVKGCDFRFLLPDVHTELLSGNRLNCSACIIPQKRRQRNSFFIVSPRF
ncbi:hypothetical protein SDC9_196221 [bioreactor metagenome]|uniref:Uncharacterized protein n=1 Tax=bioreactor metagenome TaxID=1076179 RepID=A0A645IB93_9ZZZZ